MYSLLIALTSCIILMIKGAASLHLTACDIKLPLPDDHKRIIVNGSSGTCGRGVCYHAKNDVYLYEIIDEIPTHIRETKGYRWNEPKHSYLSKLGDLTTLEDNTLEVLLQNPKTYAFRLDISVYIQKKGYGYSTCACRSSAVFRSTQFDHDYLRKYTFGGFPNSKLFVQDGKQRIEVLGKDEKHFNLTYVNLPIIIETSMETSIDNPETAVSYIPDNEPNYAVVCSYEESLKVLKTPAYPKFLAPFDIKESKKNALGMTLNFTSKFYPRKYPRVNQDHSNVVVNEDEMTVRFANDADYVFPKSTKAFVAMFWYRWTCGFIIYFAKDNDFKYCETELKDIESDEPVEAGFLVMRPRWLDTLELITDESECYRHRLSGLKKTFHLRNLDTNQITKIDAPTEDQNLYSLLKKQGLPKITTKDQLWVTYKTRHGDHPQYRYLVGESDRKYTVKDTVAGGGLDDCVEMIEYRPPRTIISFHNPHGVEIADSVAVPSTVLPEKYTDYLLYKGLRSEDFELLTPPKIDLNLNATMVVFRQIGRIEFVITDVYGRKSRMPEMIYVEGKSLEEHLSGFKPEEKFFKYVIEDDTLDFHENTGVAEVPVKTIATGCVMFFNRDTEEVSYAAYDATKTLAELYGKEKAVGMTFDPPVIEVCPSAPDNPPYKIIVYHTPLYEEIPYSDDYKVPVGGFRGLPDGFVLPEGSFGGLLPDDFVLPDGGFGGLLPHDFVLPDGLTLDEKVETKPSMVIFRDVKTGKEIKRCTLKMARGTTFSELAPAGKGFTYDYDPQDTDALSFDLDMKAEVKCTKKPTEPLAPLKQPRRITFIDDSDTKAVLYEVNFDLGSFTEFEELAKVQELLAKYRLAPASFDELEFSTDKTPTATVVCHTITTPPSRSRFTLRKRGDNATTVEVEHQLDTPSTATVRDILEKNTPIPEFKGEARVFMRKLGATEVSEVKLTDRLEALQASHDTSTIEYELPTQAPPKPKRVTVTTTLNGVPVGTQTTVEVGHHKSLNAFVPPAIKQDEHDIVFAPRNIKDLKYDPSSNTASLSITCTKKSSSFTKKQILLMWLFGACLVAGVVIGVLKGFYKKPSLDEENAQLEGYKAVGDKQ